MKDGSSPGSVTAMLPHGRRHGTLNNLYFLPNWLFDMGLSTIYPASFIFIGLFTDPGAVEQIVYAQNYRAFIALDVQTTIPNSDV